MKLGVFGSRTLGDERVKILLLEAMQKISPTHILCCQEPAGVSEVAQRVAKETATPLTLHFLNFRYLKGAFERRSKELIKEADEFIIIHDGVSKGTMNEKKLVEKSGKKFKYIVLEKSEHSKSVGFKIESNWGTEENKTWP